MDSINRMDIAEFRERGYLQEINREFLHPLGLALEVVTDSDGSERLGGIWDYRDDPDGIRYGDGELDPVKAENVRHEFERRVYSRVARLGYVIQPIDEETS